MQSPSRTLITHPLLTDKCWSQVIFHECRSIWLCCNLIQVIVSWLRLRWLRFYPSTPNPRSPRRLTGPTPKFGIHLLLNSWFDVECTSLLRPGPPDTPEIQRIRKRCNIRVYQMCGVGESSIPGKKHCGWHPLWPREHTDARDPDRNMIWRDRQKVYQSFAWKYFDW